MVGIGSAVVAAAAIGVPVWRGLTPATPGGDADDKPREPPARPAFAEDKAPKPALPPLPFDAARAMKYLTAVCDIGPRISGSEGMAKQQALIERHFAGLGVKAARQEFQARQRSRRDAVAMANLVVAWNPAAARRVVLCTHYDTRPIADQEPNRGNWARPFVSANDGASGVALLMELGHHMKDLKADLGVDFVLFDGEEYVFEPDRSGLGGGDEYFFGSEHFADEYAKGRAARPYRYEAGVLFDLFAGRNATFPVEINSYVAARAVVDADLEGGRGPGREVVPLRERAGGAGRPLGAEPGRHPDGGRDRLRVSALAQADGHAGQVLRRADGGRGEGGDDVAAAAQVS